MTQPITDLTKLAHEHMQSIPKGAAHAAHLETLSSPKEWREADLPMGDLLHQVSECIVEVQHELTELSEDISRLEVSKHQMEQRLDELNTLFVEVHNRLVWSERDSVVDG